MGWDYWGLLCTSQINPVHTAEKEFSPVSTDFFGAFLDQNEREMASKRWPKGLLSRNVGYF